MAKRIISLGLASAAAVLIVLALALSSWPDSKPQGANANDAGALGAQAESPAEVEHSGAPTDGASGNRAVVTEAGILGDARPARFERQLSAVILDERSREPVAAVVEWGTAIALADANGQVKLDASESDSLSPVTISADGYQARRFAGDHIGSPIWDLGEVALTPKRVVVLSVRNAQGTTVSGAIVSIASPGDLGPMHRGFVAGKTNAEGRLTIGIKVGEFIVVTHPRDRSSAKTAYYGESDSIDLILEQSSHWERWIGIQDAESGQPTPAVFLEVISAKSLPPIHWSGVTDQNGIVPVPFPPLTVEVRTIPPMQVQSQSSPLGTTCSVDLESDAARVDGTVWLSASALEGSWMQFTSAASGEVLHSAMASNFRSVVAPDGLVQEFHLRSYPLAEGLLNATPFLEDASEPMYVVVSAPGFHQFDSRIERVDVTRGQVTTVPLQPKTTGSLRLLEQDAGGRAELEGSRAPCSVWMFGKTIKGPGIRLVPDATGLVGNVPDLSQTALICTAPNPGTSIAEVRPEDLHLDPPLEIRISPRSQIIVEFAPGVSPTRDLRILSQDGAVHSPTLVGDTVVFRCLSAGRYVVGTARQLAEPLRSLEFDGGSDFPLALGPGAVLRIKADSTWAKSPDDSALIRGQIVLHGPSQAYVVPLCEGAGAVHDFANLWSWSPVDSSGRFSLPARADTRSLACGTFEAQQGVFVPLAVFEPGDANVNVRGAHVSVYAADGVDSEVVLELRINPQAFNGRQRLARGLLPGRAPADFGWVPLGVHSIGPIGASLSEIVVGEAGVLVFVLQADGSVMQRP